MKKSDVLILHTILNIARENSKNLDSLFDKGEEILKNLKDKPKENSAFDYSDFKSNIDKLIHVTPMPNIEYVAMDHNDAVDYLRLILK